MVSDHLAPVSLGAIWRADVSGKWVPDDARSSRDAKSEVFDPYNPAAATRGSGLGRNRTKRTIENDKHLSEWQKYNYLERTPPWGAGRRVS